MNWRTINTETRSFWKKMIFQKLGSLQWTPWDVTLLMLFPLTPFCIFESNISGFPQLFCRTDIFSNCTSAHPCPTVMRLLESFTWWEKCFALALPSGRWPRPFCQRSSSWGCSLSWWWRPAAYWACSLDSAAPAEWTAALCVYADTLVTWK